MEKAAQFLLGIRGKNNKIILLCSMILLLGFPHIQYLPSSWVGLIRRCWMFWLTDGGSTEEGPESRQTGRRCQQGAIKGATEALTIKQADSHARLWIGGRVREFSSLTYHPPNTGPPVSFAAAKEARNVLLTLCILTLLRRSQILILKNWQVIGETLLPSYQFHFHLP